MSNNFPGYLGDGVAVAAAAVFTTPTKIALTAFAKQAVDALVDNRLGVDVYVNFGAADVSVTANCVRVPAGSMLALAKGAGNEYAAIMTASGAGSVLVHCAQGS